MPKKACAVCGAERDPDVGRRNAKKFVDENGDGLPDGVEIDPEIGSIDVDGRQVWFCRDKAACVAGAPLVKA